MAVNLSDDRAHGAELLVESVILVGLRYEAGEALPTSGSHILAPLAKLRPYYDKRARQLWLDGALLMRVYRNDSNQALILRAFADDDESPDFIYDPLTPEGELDPRRRLHDTLFALNRSITAQADPDARYLVQFHAEQRATVIRWQVIDAAQAREAHAAPRVWRPETGSRGLRWRPQRCK